VKDFWQLTTAIVIASSAGRAATTPSYTAVDARSACPSPAAVMRRGT